MRGFFFFETGRRLVTFPIKGEPRRMRPHARSTTFSKSEPDADVARGTLALKEDQDDLLVDVYAVRSEHGFGVGLGSIQKLEHELERERLFDPRFAQGRTITW